MSRELAQLEALIWLYQHYDRSVMMRDEKAEIIDKIKEIALSPLVQRDK